MKSSILPILFPLLSVTLLRAAEPSAHDPQFNNKTAWPALTGKEYYIKQEWPAGRLYVWAKPGESAGHSCLM
jgi:hypothetical protein